MPGEAKRDLAGNKLWSAMPAGLGRRRLLISFTLAPLLVAGSAPTGAWHNFDVSGSAPRLAFTMTDAGTAREITAADFRGYVVMLYFGYTQCPDVCPLTLHNIADLLGRIGKEAEDVRVLFVTVDPNRDTLPLLKQYTAVFAPQIVGLRGTPDELARLARRYRLAYSVSPATKTHPYEVMHSSAVYIFDREGYARLLMTSLETANPDLSGATDDLERLLHRQKSDRPGQLPHLF